MSKLPIEDLYSEEMLRNIGIFFATCATVENVLALQLVRLIAYPQKPDSYSIFAFVGMETKVKLKLIKDLAFFKLVGHSEEIGKACDKIRRSFDHRNAFAHMSNGPKDKNHIRLHTMRLKSNGELEEPKNINEKHIKEYAQSLLERINVLVQLLTAAGVKPLSEYPEPTPEPNRE